VQNPISHAPSKLLIADDSAEMRALLRRMCVHAFNEIVECTDGEQAVTLFSQQHPDCVLLDIAMPRQDGLTAMARILARDPAARVIIVSQHDSAPFRHAAAQGGASGFVSKNDLSSLNELLPLQPGADHPIDSPPAQKP
jgi:CheY-like chemotaxis protein